MPYEVFLIIWLGVHIVFAALSAFLASRWGRDPFGWLLIGVVLGPVGFLLLIINRLLGSPAQSITLTSGEPRGAGSGPRVLVAVDGSAMSEGAVQYVRDRLGKSVGEVSVVGVLPLERAEGASMEEGSARRQLLEEETERLLGSSCATLRDAGIACKAIIRFGDPAGEILKLADEVDCDLIVMGRRGAGNAAKLLLGSVSGKVSKESSRPVTVVG